MLIYLHGFNSSAQSHKAQLLGRAMRQRGLGELYACPDLAPLAGEAVRKIESLMHGRAGICLVGSSLGGFYATYLAEKHGCKAVLINPAVEPQVGLRAYLGPQKNLHTGEPYELTGAHLSEWAALECARITPQHYLLLVETGDEVLDYRRAVARYAGAEQIVVEGGDHSLQCFARMIPKILQFAGLAR